MPKRVDIKKFWLSDQGRLSSDRQQNLITQERRHANTLKEEGYEVILVNSNPATIMTDTEMADRVYIEPLTLEFVAQIIRKERPDGILATFGGQTGLNMAVELSQMPASRASSVSNCSVRNLCDPNKRKIVISSGSLMNEMNEPVPESDIVHSLGEALEFVEHIGFPVIIRPAYTLGGTGGGIAQRRRAEEIVANGLKMSPVHQCLIEKSIAGFKEIEYEVMRDSSDHAIVVCNMENIDPVGHSYRAIQHRCSTEPNAERPRIPNAAQCLAENHPRS